MGTFQDLFQIQIRMFFADIKSIYSIKLLLLSSKCYNDFTIQYRIYCIQIQITVIDYNKIETSRIWQLTVLTYHT